MIARGGLSLVIAPAILAALLLGAAIGFSSKLAVALTLPVGIVFLFILVFFRDPPRKIGRGVVSPADGMVVEVDAAARRVAIYMGIFDVHVNRAPWSGVVLDQSRQGGGFSRASSPAAARNYSLEWRFTTLLGPLSLRQVAGVFARRIVAYMGEGASVKKGQRIGLIRFGSRVEVTLPPTVAVVVGVGDRVRAGETTIGEVAHATGRRGSVR